MSTYTYSLTAYPRTPFLYDASQHLFRPTVLTQEAAYPVGSVGISQGVNFNGSYIHLNFTNLAKSAVDNTARLVVLENYPQTIGSSSPGFITYNGLKDSPGYMYGGTAYSLVGTSNILVATLATLNVNSGNTFGLNIAVLNGVSSTINNSLYTTLFFGKDAGFTATGSTGLTDLNSYLNTRLKGSAVGLYPSFPLSIGNTPTYNFATSSPTFKIPGTVAIPGPTLFNNTTSSPIVFGFTLYLDDYENYQTFSGIVTPLAIPVSFSIPATTNPSSSTLSTYINSGISAGIATFNATYGTNYSTTAVVASDDSGKVSFFGNTVSRISIPKGVYRFSISESSSSSLTALGMMSAPSTTYAFAHDYSQVLSFSGGTYNYSVSAYASATGFTFMGVNYVYNTPASITSNALLAQAIGTGAVTPTLPSSGYTFSYSGTTVSVNYWGSLGGVGYTNFDPIKTPTQLTFAGGTVTLISVLPQIIGSDPYSSFALWDSGTSINSTTTTKGILTDLFAIISKTQSAPLLGVHTKLPYAQVNAPYVIPTLNMESNLTISSLVVRGNLTVQGTVFATSINNATTLNGAYLSTDSTFTSNSNTLVPTQQATKTFISSTYTGIKNLIINGCFDVWQRGTSISLTSSSPTYSSNGILTGTWVTSGGTSIAYLCDRWTSVAPTASLLGTITVTQQIYNATALVPTSTSTLPPLGSSNFVRISYNTLNATCPIATSLPLDRVTKLIGQTISVQAQVRGYGLNAGSFQLLVDTATSGTGTANSSLTASFNNLGIVSSSIAVSNMSTSSTGWSKLTLTYLVPTNVIGLRIRIVDTGASTTTAFYDIGAVQLEVNSFPTSLEVVPYELELQRCQKYLYSINSSSFTPSGSFLSIGYATATNTATYYIPFPTQMRISPSMAYTLATNFSSYNFTSTGVVSQLTSLAVGSGTSIYGAALSAGVTAITQGMTTALVPNVTTAMLWFNAEI